MLLVVVRPSRGAAFYTHAPHMQDKGLAMHEHTNHTLNIPKANYQPGSQCFSERSEIGARHYSCTPPAWQSGLSPNPYSWLNELHPGEQQPRARSQPLPCATKRGTQTKR